jgi:hypothetical protein
LLARLFLEEEPNWSWFMTLAKCALALVFVLVGNSSHVFQIAGDKMEGALRLEDGPIYRRIYLKKES